jgi:hypothetical protein
MGRTFLILSLMLTANVFAGNIKDTKLGNLIIVQQDVTLDLADCTGASDWKPNAKIIDMPAILCTVELREPKIGEQVMGEGYSDWYDSDAYSYNISIYPSPAGYRVYFGIGTSAPPNPLTSDGLKSFIDASMKKHQVLTSTIQTYE